MSGHLLLRGLIAGLIAGFVAFGFARVYGEPEVERAIAFEELMAAAEAPAEGAVEEPEAVSRETQAGIGLLTGVLAYSVAMGGIFSLVFAGLYGRVGSLSPRTLSLLLGAAAFVALVAVPDLKYPPNPPAVGDPETIGARTGLFFVVLAASIFALALAVAFARRLGEQLGRWNGAIVAGVAYVVFLAIVFRLLPAINEVPENFPATALYDFRLATIGLQLTLWTVLALVFGHLAEKSLVRSGNYRAVPARA